MRRNSGAGRYEKAERAHMGISQEAGEKHRKGKRNQNKLGVAVAHIN